MSMYRGLQHPEITCIERTGYPSWMQPDDDGFGQDAYESYCDSCYEENRERELCGNGRN